jgi:hypothetical protein
MSLSATRYCRLATTGLSAGCAWQAAIPVDCGLGLDSAHELFKYFLFPFYLNKFQKFFQISKIR